MNYIPLDWADLRLLTYTYFIKFRKAAYFGQNRTLFFVATAGRGLGLQDTWWMLEQKMAP